MHLHSQIEIARRIPERPAPATDRLRIAGREHVFHEGDEAEWLFEIVSGAVALYRNTLDGSRVIEGVRFPGEVIGHARRGAYRTSALAVQPATHPRSGTARAAAAAATPPARNTLLADSTR